MNTESTTWYRTGELRWFPRSFGLELESFGFTENQHVQGTRLFSQGRRRLDGVFRRAHRGSRTG